MGASRLDIYTDEVNEIAVMAKVLAHPARVAILKYISNQDSCICSDIVVRGGSSCSGGGRGGSGPGCCCMWFSFVFQHCLEVLRFSSRIGISSYQSRLAAHHG